MHCPQHRAKVSTCQVCHRETQVLCWQRTFQQGHPECRLEALWGSSDLTHLWVHLKQKRREGSGDSSTLSSKSPPEARAHIKLCHSFRCRLSPQLLSYGLAEQISQHLAGLVVTCWSCHPLSIHSTSLHRSLSTSGPVPCVWADHVPSIVSRNS